MLSALEQDLIRRWIAQGAVYELHWAFVPPVRPTPPPVTATNRVRNSIDQFILARLEEEKREAEDAAKYKNRAKVGFGSQIRNYFLHPSQRVKDSRTGYLEHNFENILDGNLQGFLDAYLKWRMKGELAGTLGDDE